jgi:hypothetical protein
MSPLYPVESDTDDVDVDVDADIQMRQMMGFGSFGMQKPGMSLESYLDLTFSQSGVCATTVELRLLST